MISQEFFMGKEQSICIDSLKRLYKADLSGIKSGFFDLVRFYRTKEDFRNDNCFMTIKRECNRVVISRDYGVKFYVINL